MLRSFVFNEILKKIPFLAFLSLENFITSLTTIYTL